MEMNPEAPRPRVLIVDDSEHNIRLVQLLLRKLPVELHSASNGEAAVSRVRDSRFHLVFMDIQMPVMDGLTAIRSIREWEQQQNCERTPIVTLTANDHDGSREASFAAGCDEHLMKPVERQLLIDAVERYALHTGCAR